MVASFSVKGDVKAMIRDLDKVQRKIVPRITSQSLNRAANKVRTESVREVAKRKQVKAKLVRERFRISRASPRRAVAIVRALLVGIKAAKLGAMRETRAGAKAGRHTFPGHFIATMPSGHEGVFKRRGGPRLPIREATIALQPEAEAIIGRHVRTTGGATFVKEFERNLARRLERR